MIHGAAAFVVAVLMGGSGVIFGACITEAEDSVNKEKRSSALTGMIVSVVVLIIALGIYAFGLWYGTTYLCPVPSGN